METEIPTLGNPYANAEWNIGTGNNDKFPTSWNSISIAYQSASRVQIFVAADLTFKRK